MGKRVRCNRDLRFHLSGQVKGLEVGHEEPVKKEGHLIIVIYDKKYMYLVFVLFLAHTS